MKKVTIIAALAATMLSMTSCHSDVHYCMEAYDAAMKLQEHPGASVHGYRSTEEAESVFRAYYNYMSDTERAKVQQNVENYKRAKQNRSARRAENERACDAMLNK